MCRAGVPSPAAPPDLACLASPGQSVLLRVLLAQRRNLVLKVSERLEPPVDRGEAQVSNLVELPQRPENRQSNLMRRNLGRPPRPEHVIDALSQVRELI